MDNLLVLTDFTPKSDHAIQFALSLLQNQSCTVHLLSIQKVWEYTTDDLIAAKPQAALDDSILGDNKSKLSAAVERLEKRYKNSSFHFEPHVDYDVFTASINQAVHTFDIDLIVVGSDGPSDVLEYFLGSHALRVIRRTQSPVLVVPYTSINKDSGNLLITLDLQQHVAQLNLLFIYDLFAAKVKSIQLVKLIEDTAKEGLEQSQLTRLRTLFEDCPVSFKTLEGSDWFASSQVVVQLESYLAHIIIAHEQSFVKRIFSGSNLSRMLQESRIPLLVLQHAD
ncbi:universal stress protein [Croceiramulus getboli]|nr:universal stress protein [Flavobacteriaceae bacterium YJPT1-3]